MKKSAGSRNTNEKQIHDTTRKANEKDRLSETSAITLSPPHDDNIGQLEKISNTKDGEEHSSVNTKHRPNSGAEKKKAFFHHFHKFRQATLELAKKVFSRLKKAGRKMYRTAHSSAKEHFEKVHGCIRSKKNAKNVQTASTENPA